MEYVYCAGSFPFDCRDRDYAAVAASDYRAGLLGGAELLLQNNGPVRISDRLTYVGPFYFETPQMEDRQIVREELRQLQSCTLAVFLLDRPPCPGTVAELIYAACAGKRVRVYYVTEEKETESALRSPFWYPMTLCREAAPDRTVLIPCADASQAQSRLLAFLRAQAG